MKNFIITCLFYLSFSAVLADSSKVLQFEGVESAKSSSKLDFSNSVSLNDALVDLRKLEGLDEDDGYFLNVLMHNLKDVKIVSSKDFKKILQYKRQKSENIKGVKLICGDDPFFDEHTDSVLIGLEFQSLTEFIGFGFENDIWYDFLGTYKRTSRDIELDYLILNNNERDSIEISRETLEIGMGQQCAILNPAIDMKKIIKSTYLNILEKSTNKL